MSRTLEFSADVGITVAVPCLTVLAYRGWVKRLRSELPRWRNIVGLVSLSSLFLSWLGFVIPTLLIGVFKVQHPLKFSFAEVLLAVQLLLALIGMVSAVALERASRTQSVAAGLLLVLLSITTLNI